MKDTLAEALSNEDLPTHRFKVALLSIKSSNLVEDLLYTIDRLLCEIVNVAGRVLPGRGRLGWCEGRHGSSRSR